MICTRCLTSIKPGQLYISQPWSWGRMLVGPVHVACPTEREIAHRKRVGREP